MIPQVEIFDELDAQIAGVDIGRDEIEEEGQPEVQQGETQQAEIQQANLEGAGQTGEQPADTEEVRLEGPIILHVVGVLFALLTLFIDLMTWVFGSKM